MQNTHSVKSVALMQPYLFPYLGYFQLVNSVDEFIIYDNVQWIKGGWINRNRILGDDGTPEYITLPVKKDSYKKYINERFFSESFESDKQAILERLREVYVSAPYFDSVYAMVESCFVDSNMNAAKFIEHCLQTCCNFLEIETKLRTSSDLSLNTESLRAQERVVSIVSCSGANRYINASGGRHLYDKDIFKQGGIELLFIEPRLLAYKQFGEPFIPGLSIIDVMMFNSQEQTKQLLESYELL